MSNFQDWDDEEFDTEQETSSRGDDNLVRQLRKQLREAEKRAKAIESELGEYRSRQRVDSIKSVLNERGLNPKVAELIPADIEANPESVSLWLDKYGEVFGIPQGDKPQTPDTSALKQINQVTNNAQIPVGEDELMLRLSQAGSADEIINMIYGQN